MAATPTSLITKPAPTQPPQFIALGKLNGALENYFLTRAAEDLATVWIDDGGPEPTLDRSFAVSELEVAVAWLGRKESRDDPTDSRGEVDSLGRFSWEDSTSDLVYQLLPCGDSYLWELAELRLFIRAFKQMEVAGHLVEPVL